MDFFYRELLYISSSCLPLITVKV